MSSSVDKIKERLSIVDVISSYLTVQKAGKNFRARCPFHNEKTPSFFISRERGMYYCFGCGAKGDIFSFVQHFEGTDFLGALKILAERAGVSLSDFKKEDKDKKDVLYKILEDATSYYQKNLSSNKEALEYLVKRGLSKDSIKNFRIGYAIDSWSDIYNYLLKKGYKNKDIEAVGLIKNKDGRYYDRFRSRIMFPINDSSGRVIAFSGRIFNSNNDKQEEAKYINSPETELFNKSNVLFGLDKAKNSIRTKDYTIIVEGQMDLILSHQAGFTNTVAVSGTAFTDTTFDDNKNINNLGLVKRLSSNIIFAYDGDDAGIRAANRSAIIALSLDMQVKIAIFPKGKDPADIISEDYKKWGEIIKNKTDIISFHLDKICESTKDKEKRRREIEEKIFPFLYMMNSSIKISNYIKEIYDKTGISELAIDDDYKIFEKKKKKGENMDENKNREDKLSRRENLERKLFGIILWGGENDDEINKIKEVLSSFKNDIGEEKYNNILKLYEAEKEQISFEAEVCYAGKKKLLFEEVEELVLNLEEGILNDEAYLLLLKIKENENNKNKEFIKDDLINYQKLVEKIEKIKKNRAK